MDSRAQGSPTKRRRNSQDERVKDELSNILRFVATDFGLYLPSVDSENGIHRPPSNTGTVEERIERRIQFLFWKDRRGLESILAEFKSGALEPKDKTASALLGALSDLYDSVSSCKPSMSNSFSGRFGADTSGLKAVNEREFRSACASFISNASTSTRSFTSIASSGPINSMRTSFTEGSIALEDPFQCPPPQTANQPADIEDKTQLLPNSLEHYQVRDLPGKGFFVKPLPALLHKASERVRYECVRIALSCNLDIDEIAKLYSDAWEDYAVLWSQVSSLIPAGTNIPKVSKSAWNAAAPPGSPILLRTARFDFRKESDSEIFRLTLEPIQQLQAGKTCRLFRHFGAHRFLKLKIPSMRNMTEHLKTQQSNLRARIEHWCAGPAKELAGYEWRVFFIRPGEYEKKTKKQVAAEYVVFLFAERGLSLKPIPVGDMLRWFLPFDNNMQLSVQKAFARIELGLSKAYTTIVFKPSQIRWVPDILADGAAGDTSFMDPVVLNGPFGWKEKHDPDSPSVMNDGCSRISSSAANRVWAKLEQQGPCPSVFQARIGPFKGIWMVAAASGQSIDDEDIWLEVTPSQRKFMPHDEDRNDTSFQLDRLTFEVLRWSSKSSESSLYRDYLPILEDRGVPRNVLSNLVTEMLNSRKLDFFAALKSTPALFKWDERLNSATGGFNDGRTQFCGAMPSKVASKVAMLVGAGFDVASEYLVRQVKNLAGSHFKRLTAEFDISLPRSTHVFGVADPVQCLGPDEIHLAFSSRFGEELFPYLDNVDALVARHPALRRSDMQKVRVVYKEALRHLLDVVVFPTRGCIPLAGKLQGGDYDGDVFWICWEPSIVEPYRNFPPQNSHQLTPDVFGIEIDRRKLIDIHANDDLVGNFLAAGLRASFQKQLLGVVTNFHGKLCYSQNSIATKEAETVVDLHDFLVDSSKNGYSFTPMAWKRFKQSLKGIDSQKIENVVPAFLTLTQSSLFDSKVEPVHNRANIIDYMIFHVARIHTKETLDDIKSFTAVNQTTHDAALSKLYLDGLASGDPITVHILSALKPRLNEICVDWEKKYTSLMENYQISVEKRALGLKENTEDTYSAYELLIPAEKAFLGDPNARALWLRRSIAKQPNHWELVKASTIFTVFPKYQDFVFDCAGKDLCYIKAHSTDRPYLVVPSIYSNLKMKKAKALAVDDAVRKDALTLNEEEDAFVHALAEYDYDYDTEEDEIEMLEAYKEGIDAMSQKLERSSLDSPKKRRLSRPT